MYQAEIFERDGGMSEVWGEKEIKKQREVRAQGEAYRNRRARDEVKDRGTKVHVSKLWGIFSTAISWDTAEAAIHRKVSARDGESARERDPAECIGEMEASGSSDNREVVSGFVEAKRRGDRVSGVSEIHGNR